MEDFFISYNRADEGWATWVAWQLEEDGHSVIIQAWDFKAGENFVARMQHAATECRRTIAILSSNYLRAEFTLAEWGAAFANDPTGKQGTLLPVRVEEIKAPGLLSAINYIDLVDKYEEDARRILLTSVRRVRAKPASPPPYPGRAVKPEHPGLFPNRGKPKYPGPIPSEKLDGVENSLLRGLRKWVLRWRKRRNPEIGAEAARLHLLKQVRSVCIDGMLGDMEREAGAPFNVKVSVSKESVDAATAAVVETDVCTAFDNADHLLLILGAQGTGKTFKLLELLKELLQRVEHGRERRIPVYLNLSSWGEWADKKRPFSDWVISEVMSAYGLSSRVVVERWVEGEELALLLDGLDEITAGRAETGTAGEENAQKLSVSCRRRCLDEINNYINWSNIWLALSCRKNEYRALGKKLFNRRDEYLATVNELEDAEVIDYLERAGPKLKSLREAVETDPRLRKMAGAPLLLRMMSVAYRDKPGVTASVIVGGGRGGEAARWKDLFEKYVQERRLTTDDPLPKEYSLKSIRDYLGQLADKMEQDKSNIFHVDGLQPSSVWLSPSDRWLYRLLVSLLLFLFVWVLVGLPAGWALGYEWASRPWAGQAVQHLEPIGETIRSFSVENMLRLTLCCGGIVAAGFALFKSWGFGAMCGLAIGLSRTLTVKLGPGDGSIEWLAQGPISIVLGIGVSLLMMHERDHDRDQISPLKRSQLHLRPALIGAGVAAGVGVILGAFLSGILGWKEGLPRGLAFGSALIPVCVLFNGYRNVGVEIKTRANQGIRYSAFTALWTALWSALTGVVCFGGFYWSFLGPQRGVVSAILGLSLSVISLVYGCIPVMQHWSLRTVLYLRGRAPLRLVRFLKAAESLRLLRRIGGGYSFQHESLRKYFLEYHRAKGGREVQG